jgi:hypothetical protein
MEILHEKGHPIARHLNLVPLCGGMVNLFENDDSDLPTLYDELSKLVSVIDKRNYIAWLVTCQQSTVALFHHDGVWMVADSHPSFAMHEPTRSNITQPTKALMHTCNSVGGVVVLLQSSFDPGPDGVAFASIQPFRFLIYSHLVCIFVHVILFVMLVCSVHVCICIVIYIYI